MDTACRQKRILVLRERNSGEQMMETLSLLILYHRFFIYKIWKKLEVIIMGNAVIIRK